MTIRPSNRRGASFALALLVLLALARWRLEGASGQLAELVWPLRMAFQGLALGGALWRLYHARDPMWRGFWGGISVGLATWFVILAARPGGEFARAQRVVEDLAFLGLYVGFPAAFEYATFAGAPSRPRPGAISGRIVVWAIGVVSLWVYFPLVASLRAPDELSGFVSSNAMFVALDVAVLVRIGWALARVPRPGRGVALGMAATWLIWTVGDIVSLVGMASDGDGFEDLYDVTLYLGHAVAALTTVWHGPPGPDVQGSCATLERTRPLGLRSLCAGWAVGLPATHVVTYATVVGSPAVERLRALVALGGGGLFLAALVALTRRHRDDDGTVLVRRDDLEQIERMNALGRMAAGVAHDFNNLLTAIDGYAQLGAQDAGGEAREVIEQIRVAVSRGRELSSQLLTFGRRQRMERRLLDLGDVVRDSESLLRRLAGDEVTVRLSIEDGAHPVTGDPTRLWQVLANLVANARDAMPDGGTVTVSVSRAVMDDGSGHRGRWILLEVADTGRGMDAATRERIFEPFFTTRPGTGTGLGLSTVYGIVTQSGGSIHVDSAPGRGAVFHVFLPVGRPEADDDGGGVGAVQSPRPGEATRAPVGRGGAARILVVDDEEAVRAMACRYLRGLGYETVEAEDARSALGEMERGRFSLMLTDVVLPGGIDGVELARRARSRDAAMAVVWMSGFADVPDGTLLEPFLQKPFGLVELGRVVARALEGVV